MAQPLGHEQQLDEEPAAFAPAPQAAFHLANIVVQQQAEPDPGDHILLIHESLDCLEQEDPEAARIVMLKFFSGLGSAKIARMEECSVRTVERRWTFAKARLYQIIRGAGFSRPPTVP